MFGLEVDDGFLGKDEVEYKDGFRVKEICRIRVAHLRRRMDLSLGVDSWMRIDL